MGCADTTGPPPVVTLAVTSYSSDGTAFLAFHARASPGVSIRWSLVASPGLVGPLYGHEPGGRPVLVTVWFPGDRAVSLVFTATPRGGEPAEFRVTRTPGGP